jgi:hypothetical protein
VNADTTFPAKATRRRKGLRLENQRPYRGALAGLLGAIIALYGLTSSAVEAEVRNSSSVTVLAAGDIAVCRSPGAKETAKLIENMAGTVLAVGDLAYPNGTRANFKKCYEPTWGRFKDRTLPTPGNHEYITPGAAAYFDYFGGRAGEKGKGYYSVDLQGWHIIAINSSIGTGAGSEQMDWLQKDLSKNKAPCILAFWHHARFSSGPHGDNVYMDPIWETLAQHHASIVISGHDHSYERLAPLDAMGQVDEQHGIRSFIVGTGGARLYNFSLRRPYSEAWNGKTWGVLKLNLFQGGYSWEFIPVAGGHYHDSGEGQCAAE